MTLDLNTIEIRKVLPIIEWCFEHNIDRLKCATLLTVWYSKPPLDWNDWTIEIPDKYVSFVILKWL